MARRVSTRKNLRLAFVVLAFIAIYLYLQLGRDRIDEPMKQPAQVTAVEIIDGDTFRDSKGETIRLLGVDTPERGQPLYSSATVYLDSLLYGKSIRYEFDLRKRDRHGRLLAYVFTEGAFVNRELLKSGLASVYIFPDDMKNEKYRMLFIEDQYHARQIKAGIWSIIHNIDEAYYIGNSNTYRFHRPNCRSIENIEEHSKIEKKTRDEFLDIGFAPCRNCKP